MKMAFRIGDYLPTLKFISYLGTQVCLFLTPHHQITFGVSRDYRIHCIIIGQFALVISTTINREFLQPIMFGVSVKSLK
jgi:hypothetical protein